MAKHAAHASHADAGRDSVPIATAGVAAALLALVALIATGCGRKATQADCDLIVDRYVEVQLKAMNINDPVTIEKQKADQRAAMKDELHDCVGKRVTDGMLACVKKAQTNDEIDKCTH